MPDQPRACPSNSENPLMPPSVQTSTTASRPPQCWNMSCQLFHFSNEKPNKTCSTGGHGHGKVTQETLHSATLPRFHPLTDHEDVLKTRRAGRGRGFERKKVGTSRLASPAPLPPHTRQVRRRTQNQGLPTADRCGGATGLHRQSTPWARRSGPNMPCSGGSSHDGQVPTCASSRTIHVSLGRHEGGRTSGWPWLSRPPSRQTANAPVAVCSPGGIHRLLHRGVAADRYGPRPPPHEA